MSDLNHTHSLNSILPNYGWATPAPCTVVETIEYDDQGRIIKRTTATTEQSPPKRWNPSSPWLYSSSLQVNT